MKPPIGFKVRARVTNDMLESRVEVVELGTIRRLAILNIGDAIADLEGAIVWIRPVKGSTPEQVATYAQLAREARAARVVVLPMAAEDAAAPLATVAATSDGETIRQNIEALLAEVQEQPDLVRKIVELALEEAGL